MNGKTMKERELLISDYVLGQASAEEHLHTEQLMVDDDDLNAEIQGLRERLHELDYTAKPELVTSDLWSRVEEKLEEKEERVVALDDYRTSPVARASSGYWRGFVTSAIAASLLFFVATGAFLTLGKTPEPVAIAILVDGKANPGALIEAMADNQVRVRPLVNINVPAGRALEVWTLQDPDEGPVSLGLLRTAADTTLTDFDLPRPNAEQLYEITLEPADGSPIGRPTGPILFKGFAKLLR